MPVAATMIASEPRYFTSHGSHDSNTSRSPPPESAYSGSKKRSNSVANLDQNGSQKTVKRRAAKACAACRARKVRCDVMQRYHVTADGGVTCSNCTMDNVKCIIEESKRRKKHLSNGQPSNTTPSSAPISSFNRTQSWENNGLVNPTDISNGDARRWSNGSAITIEGNDDLSAAHVPHSIYQNVNHQISKGELPAHPRQSFSQPNLDPDFLVNSVSIHGDRIAARLETPPVAPHLKHQIPDYLKPLPQRMTSVDIDYLFAKGALSLPNNTVRNALLQAYIEYVHPYMPLIDLHELLYVIQDETGESGRLSLLLFQAIMFAGTAFVDIEHLRSAGFTNRKAARKAFFQRARVLYDFDYELDRVALVQSLLLMTYWYETPDDQKDTWHWMGVAISLAHTIGLHRNPEDSNMLPHKKKLWKRIWWSCFMRDRLIALGMRRPTRVKDEDYDVPMLTEDDFDIEVIQPNITIIPWDCTIVRDLQGQKRLAQMCIAKAKLCLCISHVLTAQYSVLVKAQGMQPGNNRSSVMLFPKKIDQTDEVKRCDEELSTWIKELPESCAYSNEIDSMGTSVFVQRSLLHMVYFTTLSALHRPQVLPSATSTQPADCRELQDLSRKKVREASNRITRISHDLHQQGLEKYLPTTGVTVLIPAIIIHLLDIKASNEDARQAAMEGFCQCMLVLEKLRDNYASADYATQFLEAAIRKADIDVLVMNSSSKERMLPEAIEATLTSSKIKELRERTRAARQTPPVAGDDLSKFQANIRGSGLLDISLPAGRTPEQNSITAHTPPDSVDHTNTTSTTAEAFTPSANVNEVDLAFNATVPDIDMNDFLNFDGNNDLWTLPLEQGAHGESGGFMGDMNWIDDGAQAWSRLNSPIRDLGEGEKAHDQAANWRLESPDPGHQEMFNSSLPTADIEP